MRPRLPTSRRGRLLAGAALIVVVGGTVAGVVFTSGGGSGTPAPAVKPIQVRSALLPDVALFGDTVTARLDVILDRERIDPGSVTVETEFAPWKPVAPPKRVVRDGDTTTYIATTYVLRCLEADCTSQKDSSLEDFGNARVSYSARGGGPRQVLEVPWPKLVVDSRYAQNTFRAAGATAAPWKAALFSTPPVSYAVSPFLLFALLIAGCVVLLLLAVLLVRRARRRPEARPVPVRPEPAPPPRVLTPLERALLLLEITERIDGAGDQRRALERVAEELARRGESELARQARALAWSERKPGADETNRLAAGARSRLGKEADAPAG